MSSDPVLKALRDNRQKLMDDLGMIVAKAEAANRGLSVQEDADFSRISAAVKELDVRIDNAKSENKRRTDSMRNGAKVIAHSTASAPSR